MRKSTMLIGRTAVSVRAMGPSEAGYWIENWSLKPLQTKKNVLGNRRLATGLRRVLNEMGVHRAYAPNITEASAEIVCANVLSERIDLGSGVVLCRNKSVPADGIFIGKGHAFVMSAAGCGFIIATAGEQMVVAHAGRDSLIDRGAPIDEPSRRYPSVVHNIVEAFRDRGMLSRDISMRMMFSIPVAMFEHRFDHPVHGAYNYELARFVDTWWSGCVWRRRDGIFLDLERLFEKQALELGVRDILATHSLAEFPNLVHTRDGGDTKRRNLFVVKREQVA